MGSKSANYTSLLGISNDFNSIRVKDMKDQRRSRPVSMGGGNRVQFEESRNDVDRRHISRNERPRSLDFNNTFNFATHSQSSPFIVNGSTENSLINEPVLPHKMPVDYGYDNYDTLYSEDSTKSALLTQTPRLGTPSIYTANTGSGSSGSNVISMENHVADNDEEGLLLKLYVLLEKLLILKYVYSRC